MSLLVYASLAGVLWVLWRFFKEYFVKSPLDNIQGPDRSSFLRGNQPDLFNRHGWDFHSQMSEQYGQVAKVHGPFGSRGLYVFDPKALNSIIMKDQMIYEEPRWFLEANMLFFGPGLLSTQGLHHRKQRKLLNPVFSIAHMRQITPVFYGVTHRLRDAVASQIAASPRDINILEWMGRCALELVGQGGLGYSFDPLVINTHNSYGDALKEFLPTIFNLHFWRVLVPYCVRYIPLRLRQFAAPWIPHSGIQKLRGLTLILDQQSKQIYLDKKAAVEKGDESAIHQVKEGRDILSVLMKANMEASEEDRLPEREIIAQISSLTLAAMDTTSNALSRIFQTLAQHPEVQDKLRAELLDASPGGADIPYDQLVDLPYLDAICRETLRLYPPVTFMSREARADIVMPLSSPIQGRDGTSITEIPVPKNTYIIVGIRACNRNKAIWGEDALMWKPERWLQSLPAALTDARVPGVYSNLMTFLGGGRACIGFKFSQLEMKVVLATMLCSFRFLPGDEEIYWNIAPAYYPTIGKTGTKPAMYLRLEPVEAEII